MTAKTAREIIPTVPSAARFFKMSHHLLSPAQDSDTHVRSVEFFRHSRARVWRARGIPNSAGGREEGPGFFARQPRARMTEQEIEQDRNCHYDLRSSIKKTCGLIKLAHYRISPQLASVPICGYNAKTCVLMLASRTRGQSKTALLAHHVLTPKGKEFRCSTRTPHLVLTRLSNTGCHRR